MRDAGRAGCAVFGLLLAAQALSAADRKQADTAPLSSGQPDPRVEKLLSQLTPKEKMDFLGGTGFGTQPVARLGIPIFRMSDGPSGVRSPAPSTAFAAGISLAATWDPALAQRVGAQIGRDARSRGSRFMLGPGANVYRSSMNGRNFEYLGEDPFLASRMVVGYINGVQSERVSATIKHFVGNDSEFARHTSDSVIDERALREIYLPAFEAAVKEAHTGAVMSSYNLINGDHATASAHGIRILKGDWGFNGVYMSDWSATYDGVAAANAGLDLEMPSGRFMNEATLDPAVRSGKVQQSLIDDKVRRILATANRFGWLDGDPADLAIPRYNQDGRAVARQGALESAVLLKNANHLLPLDTKKLHNIAVIGPNAYPGVTTGGGSGHVTAFAAKSVLQGLSDKLSDAATSSVTVTYNRGLPTNKLAGMMTAFSTAKEGGKPGVVVDTFPDTRFSGKPQSSRVESQFIAGSEGFGGDPDLMALVDTMSPERMRALLGGSMGGPPPQAFDRWTAWYTAAAAGSYSFAVQDTGAYRLLVDDEVVTDFARIPKAIMCEVRRTLSAGPHQLVLEQVGGPDVGRTFLRVSVTKESELVDPLAKQLAAKADAVVLVVGFDADIETEGGDREFGLPPGQAQLIREIGAVNPNTIVVINSGGAVDVTPWIDSAGAVIAAWYPGQEGGTAMADILTGDAEPTGRLPISWDCNAADNPSFANYYYNDPAHPDRIVYREGVFVGYRGYQHQERGHADTEPLFPFGFGLSYTTFQYANLTVAKAPAAAAGSNPAHAALYTLSYEVTNTGTRAGTDVAQIYVGARNSRVPRPVRELKGFARVELAAGQTKRVTMALDARSFEYFEVASNQWRADPGEYRVELARSAEDVQATQSVKLGQGLRTSVSD